MVSYNTNGEYQGTQKELIEDASVKQVLSLAPYGVLGLCSVVINGSLFNT